ncbi:hypothetical protein J3E64_003818 [Sphingobium sp. OAS761]|nr:hypothetical protein [Sphingobium sp. OAS761]
MQAIGTLERAIGRLEQDVTHLAAPDRPPSPNGIDVPAAREALRSLDDLIDQLRGRTDG